MMTPIGSLFPFFSSFKTNYFSYLILISADFEVFAVVSIRLTWNACFHICWGLLVKSRCSVLHAALHSTVILLTILLMNTCGGLRKSSGEVMCYCLFLVMNNSPFGRSIRFGSGRVQSLFLVVGAVSVVEEWLKRLVNLHPFFSLVWKAQFT